jgi:tight adherence protein B
VAEHRRAEPLTRALGAFAITAALLALLVSNAGAASVVRSLGAGATFPHRALVLTVPAAIPVTVPRIYVGENGSPVDSLSVTPVTPVTAPTAASFGVVLVIDQSLSMTGAPLNHAMATARAIAAQRTGSQKVGVITFDSSPSIVLPMTSDSTAIQRALARTPWTGVGTSPLPALMAGLHQLAYAHVTNGAVILLSDGATRGATKLTPQSVGAAAQAQNARIFTVGLKDPSFAPAPMRRIAQFGGGSYLPTTSLQLPYLLTHLATSVPRSYLVRYTSILSGGQHVSVTVHVDGISKLLRTSYDAPAVSSGGAGSAGSTTSTASSTSPGSTGSSSTGSGSTASGSSASASAPAAGKTPGAKSSGVSSTSSRQAASTKGSTPGVSGTFTALSALPQHAIGSKAHRATPGTAPRVTRAPTTAAGKAALASVQPISGFVPRSPRHSFWSSSLALVLIAGGCALLIGLGVLILVFRRPARRALQQRVGSFTLGSTDGPAIPAPGAEPANPVARLLTRRPWWPAFAEQVDTARMKRTPLELVKRTAVIGLVAGAVLALVLGSVVPALLVPLFAPFVLRMLVKRGARRQQRRFNEQLPSHLQDLAGAMRAGRSFVGAMAAIVESANEPIRGEFDRALSDERLGLPLEETLEAVGRRMAAKDMEQVTLIASLNRNSGSNVAEALDRVAESARDRADLAREMRSLTGQARMSAWILTGMPPMILLALTVMAPAYGRPLFHTTMGIVMVFFAAGLLGIGWMVLNKIVNPEA